MLKDLVIDEIYTTIVEFIPQLIINRNDIKIIQKKTNLYATFKAVNMLDYTTNLYEINLTSNITE